VDSSARRRRASQMAWQPPAWATMPGRPTVALEVRRGDKILRTHDLSKRKSFLLGRQSGVADILIEEEGVSRQHFALVHKESAMYLIDLKSAAGTSVDGQRAKPLEATPLREGSQITLGEMPVRYLVRGLAPPAAPPAAVPASSWTPPSWAVQPDVPVVMQLEENGIKVQSLDLSRHASYILGRSAATAKIVVPHDSVSRQHAALVHARQGPGGSHSVHVVDLGSTKGTFIDLGSGWTRLQPNMPATLPPGGRVRLGDCATRLAYRQSLAPIGPAVPAAPTAPAAPAAPAEPEPKHIDDDTPRFDSLVSSTVVPASTPADAIREQVGAAFATEGQEGEEGEMGGIIGPSGPEEQPTLKNDDFRSALLPFLTRKAPEPSVADGKSKTKKGKKRRADDSDSDGEPPPPVVLDKSEPAMGLVLRKEKTKAKATKSTVKIKF
jgi:pSer/pThr/pTyr-binding forkhead associated (FHA) protein